jgi:hypothetical protein
LPSVHLLWRLSGFVLRVAEVGKGYSIVLQPLFPLLKVLPFVKTKDKQN